MWVHHTHDASLWPPTRIVLHRWLSSALKDLKAPPRTFGLRWTENAEQHQPEDGGRSRAGRAASTWLVNYHELIEQVP